MPHPPMKGPIPHDMYLRTTSSKCLSSPPYYDSILLTIATRTYERAHPSWHGTASQNLPTSFQQLRLLSPSDNCGIVSLCVLTKQIIHFEPRRHFGQLMYLLCFATSLYLDGLHWNWYQIWLVFPQRFYLVFIALHPEAFIQYVSHTPLCKDFAALLVFSPVNISWSKHLNRGISQDLE